VPAYPTGSEPIYMSFVVHHDRRDELATELRKRGVDTTTGYMNAFGDHPLFQDYQAICPNAAEVVRSFLHIPVHPNLTKKDVAHMVESVRSACLALR
jgi:dTDP-4-amino-4,6-dideoxygalactose transaminase